MLKTSPILPSSANASPTSFRHAAPPSRSPHESPRASLSASRRSSTRAVASPVQLRSSARNDNDSDSDSDSDSSDDSDDEPDVAIPLAAAQQRPPPAPQPMAAARLDEGPAQPPATLVVPNAALDNDQSPNKRRPSPPLATAEAGSSGASVEEQQDEQAAKRSRPHEPPPKILPQKYELCPVEDMVELIAFMLVELITTNDAIRISNGGLTRFHSRTPPGISVRDYLHRLARHATLIPPLLLAMVYYIDRLCALYPEFTINTLTVHRFLITAATVAAKGLSDSFWNNTTYARVGGVRVAELKLLELEFLYRVDWKIVPNPEVLVAYYRALVERTPGYTLEPDGSSDDGVDGVADGQDE